MKVKNNSSHPTWVAGNLIMPRSEAELELDEEGIERVERSSHLQAEREDSFECEECEDSFDSKRGLKQHERMTHEGGEE